MKIKENKKKEFIKYNRDLSERQLFFSYTMQRFFQSMRKSFWFKKIIKLYMFRSQSFFYSEINHEDFFLNGFDGGERSMDMFSLGCASQT